MAMPTEPNGSLPRPTASQVTCEAHDPGETSCDDLVAPASPSPRTGWD